LAGCVPNNTTTESHNHTITQPYNYTRIQLFSLFGSRGYRLYTHTHTHTDRCTHTNNNINNNINNSNNTNNNNHNNNTINNNINPVIHDHNNRNTNNNDNSNIHNKQQLATTTTTTITSLTTTPTTTPPTTTTITTTTTMLTTYLDRPTLNLSHPMSIVLCFIIHWGDVIVVLSQVRQRSPRLAVWASVLAMEHVVGHPTLEVQSLEGRFEFESSGGLLRKFFAVDHPGGHLASIKLHLLVTIFDFTRMGQCIGVARWLDQRVEEAFDVWDETMPAVLRRAPATQPVVPASPVSELEQQLRNGFLSTMKKALHRSDEVRHVEKVFEKLPKGVVEDDGSSASEDIDMENGHRGMAGVLMDDLVSKTTFKASTPPVVGTAPTGGSAASSSSSGSYVPLFSSSAASGSDSVSSGLDRSPPSHSGTGSASSGGAGFSSAPPEPPPEPPQEPPPRPAVPRGVRGETWGHWSIAPIVSQGIIVGYGVTCAKHSNAGENTTCKRQLPFGKRMPLSAVECRSRLKAWLLEGLPIEDGPSSRDEHMDIKPRDIEPLMPEADYDAQAQALAPPA
jgi:hypothetical protein